MESAAPPWLPNCWRPGWPPELHHQYHHGMFPSVWNLAAPAAPTTAAGWVNYGYLPNVNHGVLPAPSAFNFGRQEPPQLGLEAHQYANLAAPALPTTAVGWVNYGYGYLPNANQGVWPAPSTFHFGRQ